MIMIHSGTDQCLERGGYERSRNSKGIGMVWTVRRYLWSDIRDNVIPVVIACMVYVNLRKKLHKIVPEIIDLFVTHW